MNPTDYNNQTQSEDFTVKLLNENAATTLHVLGFTAYRNMLCGRITPKFGENFLLFSFIKFDCSISNKYV